jgi:hypothetical protein
MDFGSILSHASSSDFGFSQVSASARQTQLLMVAHETGHIIDYDALKELNDSKLKEEMEIYMQV